MTYSEKTDDVDSHLQLFITVRRPLDDAAKELGLTSRSGFDSFDDYAEASGKLEGRDGKVAYSLFSYRPSYKKTFSVATQADATAQLCVLEYLAKKLHLRHGEVLKTDENGYAIAAKPIEAFMGEAALVDRNVILGTQADASKLLNTRKGKRSYDHVMGSILSDGDDLRKQLGTRFALRLVHDKLLEDKYNGSQIRDIVEKTRESSVRAHERVLSPDFISGSNVVTSVLAQTLHAGFVNYNAFIGGISYAILLLGFDAFVPWSVRNDDSSTDHKNNIENKEEKKDVG